MYKTASKFRCPSGKVRVGGGTRTSTPSAITVSLGIKKKQNSIKSFMELTGLKVGMEVNGCVDQIEKYGAFVRIDKVMALLHVSQITDRKIKHPNEILNLDQAIKATVIKIEIKHKVFRVSLSTKLKA
jgi:ribosomal protein S1